MVATEVATLPSIVAYQELAQLIRRSPRFETPRSVDSIHELRALWEIDADAYQECSISFECFRQWWQRYPKGNTVIFDGDRIIASVGLWPLSSEQYEAFTAGQIAESELQPVPLSQCERYTTRDSAHYQGQHYWYASGIVLAKEYRGRLKNNPLLTLLEHAIPMWIESNHVTFPLHIAALGEYVDGNNLLEGFGFGREKDSSEMPDKCHLYTLSLESEDEAAQILQARNLW